MAFCTECGTQIPEGSVCPVCNHAPASMATPAVAPGSTGAGTVHGGTGGLTDNVAGMLAYITIIPAIVFLVMEPYNRNRFIRFHAFQCIFFWVALVVLGTGLTVLGMVPVLGLLIIPLHFLLWLAGVALWVILLLKASQGAMFKLPVIGDLAEKQANA
jgi:uncharacterized membrane protein